MFRRPRAATGADVTLSSDTLLHLPFQQHDRALFGTWNKQYQEQNPAHRTVTPDPAKVWRVTHEFRLPDVGAKLLWQLMRLYRDICHLSDNDEGHCFAHNQYFVDKYNRGHDNHRTKDGTFAPASEPTIRRWVSLLVEHGWIGSEVSGPNRRLWPLIHPSTLLTHDSVRLVAKPLFQHHYKRLLMSGLTPDRT